MEYDEEEYIPDLARWPEQVIDGAGWEFPAEECLFALKWCPVTGPDPRRAFLVTLATDTF